MPKIILRRLCPKCGSTYDPFKMKEHICYIDRNRDEEAIRPELAYRRELRHVQIPGECACKGRNKDCMFCGGTGRITR